jgi:hypothetical protein
MHTAKSSQWSHGTWKAKNSTCLRKGGTLVLVQVLLHGEDATTPSPCRLNMVTVLRQDRAAVATKK